MRAAALAIALLMSSGAALAQQSASFRLAEHTFNAGGRPEGGATAGSTSFSISLDALGDTVTPGLVAGGVFQLGGGFVTPYPPPGEVETLFFADAETLVWTPEPSTGVYNLYRGILAGLDDLGYGDCQESEIAGTTTTDPDSPAAGQGYFYLVTAENLIAEEGVKGTSSSGSERPNPAPCP